jgi:hypothetical protein
MKGDASTTRIRGVCGLLAAGAVLAASVVLAPSSPSVSSTPTSSTVRTVKPPADGYVQGTVASGSWNGAELAALPSDQECAERVHRSDWEPRPSNTRSNHTLVSHPSLPAELAARPRAGAHDPRWDSYLLPRVSGQFTGTTDEILQWAACKWGFPDNFARAEAAHESSWFQQLTYPDGECYDHLGCGDFFPIPTNESSLYCKGLRLRGGYDYEADYGAGQCPQTFGIAGVKTWYDPAWEPRYEGNQNGAFPFVRDSTAANIDYMLASIRGCYEGWETWLVNTGDRSYAAGDLRSCAGSWFAGAWKTARANRYAEGVWEQMNRTRPWLSDGWEPEQNHYCHTPSGQPSRCRPTHADSSDVAEHPDGRHPHGHDPQASSRWPGHRRLTPNLSSG